MATSKKTRPDCYSLCNCADDPLGECCHGDDPQFTRVQTAWSHSIKVHLRGRRYLAAACLGGRPNGAKSLVLIIYGPNAPDPKAPKLVWVHWVVYNVPPDTKSLPENTGKARLPQGALIGLNDFKKTGYGGPCPPIGRHRYFHKLYRTGYRRPISETRRNRRSSEQCRATCWPIQSLSAHIKRVTGRH